MKIKNKKILITGGTGMIARPLVEMLYKMGNELTIVSLDDQNDFNSDIKFIKCDLRYLDKCLELIKGQDIVFHLAGIKGSPVLTRDKPASFFVPTIMFNTNVLDACMKNDIEWTLYTSTVGVYGPSEFLKEDDLWKAFPSKNDWFAGWAKRMGEIQLDAYRIERKKANFSIVRPVNVHGKFDNFNPETSMVIPSLIHKIINTKDKITLWGDGSPVRDFVSAYDVARAMIFCVEHEISEPLNIGSGVGYSIKELAEKIIRLSGSKVDIEWDTTKPNGDARRVADISKLLSYGFRLEKSLDESLKEVIDWYIVNKSNLQKRYDVFLK